MEISLIPGHVSAFDIKFEDPSQGFFLREIPLTSSNEWSSTSGYNGNGVSSSSLFDARVSSNSVFPTTSIVLGSSVSSTFFNAANGKRSRADSHRRDVKTSKDALHTARCEMLFLTYKKIKGF